jgi:hypothetical protein
MAAHSLKSLLEHAVAVIPSTQHRCTPFIVKATAGSRLLSPAKAAEILRAVVHYQSDAWPFLLPCSLRQDLEGLTEASRTQTFYPCLLDILARPESVFEYILYRSNTLCRSLCVPL